METSLGHPLLSPDDTPNTSGPVIRSRVAPFLRFLLHLFNIAFASLGIVLVIWALYTGYKPPSPPQPPPPDMLSTSSDIDNYLYKGSWFLTTAGCYGAYILATSLMGFSAARYSVMGLLSIYVMCLVFAATLEAVSLLILFTKPNKIERRLPEDDPYWKEFENYITGDKHHADLVKVVVLALIAAQVVAAMLASCLHSIIKDATDVWIDQMQEIRLRRRVEYESIAARAAGGVDSRNRVRRKYGIDNRQMEAVEMEAGLWEAG